MEVKTTIAVEIHAKDQDHEIEEILKIIAIVVEAMKGTKFSLLSFYRF